ncbi:MAG: mechanosensitive ion channel family protein [Phycisphaerales bacterium]
MDSLHLLHLATDALVVGIFAYLALLGVRIAREGTGGKVTAGTGLVVASLFGLLVWCGVEFEIPIALAPGTAGTATDASAAGDAARSVLLVPLLQTIAELGAVFAAAGVILELITVVRTARGKDDLLRFQRTAIFLGLVILGLLVIYEAHFAEKLPARTAILGVGGATVFVVGLALQSTLGNVFAGYELQADRVIRKGDWVQLGRDGTVGRVVDSTLRTTSIHTKDGELVVLKNSDLLARDFRNLDRPTPVLRQLVRFGAAYDCPPALVKDVAHHVLTHERNVLRIPEPEVALLSFGDSAIVYEMRFWIPSFVVRDETLDRVQTRLWYALREAGIEIPFPMRTVRMVSPQEEAERAAAAADRARTASASLEACALFADAHVNAAERREMARDAAPMKCLPGEIIVRRGDRSDSMFVIASGGCEVMLPGAARVAIGPGGHFGEIALLRREPRTADVIAGPQGCELLRLPRASVLGILARHPELRERLGDIARERLETQVTAAGAARGPAQPSVVGGIFRMLRPW